LYQLGRQYNTKKKRVTHTSMHNTHKYTIYHNYNNTMLIEFVTKVTKLLVDVMLPTNVVFIILTK